MIQQTLGSLPDLFPGKVVCNETAHDALDVAIDYGDRLTKCDAGDGRSGVASDAGQLPESIGSAREFSAEIMRHHLRRRMQQAGPAVVPQPAPGSKN